MLGLLFSIFLRGLRLVFHFPLFVFVRLRDRKSCFASCALAQAHLMCYLCCRRTGLILFAFFPVMLAHVFVISSGTPRNDRCSTESSWRAGAPSFWAQSIMMLQSCGKLLYIKLSKGTLPATLGISADALTCQRLTRSDSFQKMTHWRTWCVQSRCPPKHIAQTLLGTALFAEQLGCFGVSMYACIHQIYIYIYIHIQYTRPGILWLLWKWMAPPVWYSDRKWSIPSKGPFAICWLPWVFQGVYLSTLGCFMLF